MNETLSLLPSLPLVPKPKGPWARRRGQRIRPHSDASSGCRRVITAAKRVYRYES